MNKVAIIIPAFNEARRIGQVLQDLQPLNCDLIVVDDASNDGTYAVAQKFANYHTRHAVNLGQGAALKTGTDLAQKLNYDIVVHSDADGQFRVEDIKAIIDKITSTDVDVVLGSRFMNVKSESMPIKKRIILWIAKVFSKLFLKLKFSDPQIGLRAFKTKVYHKLDWQKNDFQHCSEILGLISKNDLSFDEIPVIVNYDEYTTSKKVKPKMSMGWKLIINKFFD